MKTHNLMRKYSGLALAVLLSMPLAAEANQEGIWTTTTKPGHLFVVIEGDVNSGETASMVVLPPNRTSYDIYFGPDTFNFTNFKNTVNFEPLNSSSNMKFTWKANDTNGSLQVISCTQNCLWNPGQQIPFKKLYGEGVNVQGDTGGGGGGNGGGGGPNPAGIWAGQGTNPDGSRFEACFNVNGAGTQMVASGSSCDDGNALDIEIDDAREADGDDCDVNIGYSQPVTITNGSFSFSWRPPFAPVVLTVTGNISGNNATGTLESKTDFGDVCKGNWSASKR